MSKLDVIVLGQIRASLNLISQWDQIDPTQKLRTMIRCKIENPGIMEQPVEHDSKQTQISTTLTANQKKHQKRSLKRQNKRLQVARIDVIIYTYWWFARYAIVELGNQMCSGCDRESPISFRGARIDYRRQDGKLVKIETPSSLVCLCCYDHELSMDMSHDDNARCTITLTEL